jgi:23S rRNA (guanosine2251-2'-O)-methyltransferase
MREIIIVAHNIRSTHNIGSIFRSAEGFGVKKIIISGYSPYPATDNDKRLPHIREKMTDQIHKTALGAETMVPFEYVEQPDFNIYRKLGFRIVGLEQDKTSILLKDYKTPEKILLILGEEVNGITQDIIEVCDDLIEIPMLGKKESFNVSVAAGIALYGLSI